MYLRHTVASLAKAKDIENALLIFSHDYYDEEINYFIQKLNFCKIMQIFYPFSIQTHPNQFPGESPNDCPSQIMKSEWVHVTVAYKNMERKIIEKYVHWCTGLANFFFDKQKWFQGNKKEMQQRPISWFVRLL